MTKKNHESLKLYPGFSKNYNHGKKIVDKVRKLSKIAFSMECFTADFLQFSSTDFKNYLLGGRLGTGIFLKFPKSFSIKLCSTTCEVTHTIISW